MTADPQDGANDFAELPERKVELVLATVCAQHAQDGRGGDSALLDRDHHAQHIVQVFLDPLEIDAAREQSINVLVTVALVRSI